MTVVTKVNSGAENVRPLNDAQVVQHLRRGNPARGPGCVDVRLADIVEVKGRHIRPLWISLALGEQETEAGKASREFVDDVRRDHPAIAKCQVRRAAKDFTKRG